MKPLYVPRGKAKEYGDYAVNIYTGCPHGCFYCFAPQVLHRDRAEFHTRIEPRPGIVEALRKQIEREGIKDATIHLCFTCDPYPTGHDSSVTREVITAIKETGNHVQILTKGDGTRDFDLLDGNDWYGITYDGMRDGAYPALNRLADVQYALTFGIKTWCSFEPVVDADAVLECIQNCADIFHKVKIGKLNYHPSEINWKEFGMQAESLCQDLRLEYYIKESLREEMEKC